MFIEINENLCIKCLIKEVGNSKKLLLEANLCSEFREQRARLIINKQ